MSDKGHVNNYFPIVQSSGCGHYTEVGKSLAGWVCVCVCMCVCICVVNAFVFMGVSNCTSVRLCLAGKKN